MIEVLLPQVHPVEVEAEAEAEVVEVLLLQVILVETIIDLLVTGDMMGQMLAARKKIIAGKGNTFWKNDRNLKIL
jgi:hypothetical protein